MIRKPFDELQRAKDLAESASRAKTAFISNVSHEIRTPLTSMIGSLGLIAGTMSDKLPEQACKLVDLAHKNAQRLLTLVNDLLDFAKIDAGRFALENAPFSLYSSIGKVTEIILLRCREKGLDLQVRYQTPVPEEIIGDAVRFEQVLLNLLSNAVKFTEQGSIKMFIRVAQKDAGSERLYIDVVDTGIGISAEKLDYIFEKFTQEDESTTRRFGGTGLGLAISNDIVRLMGGHLKVNSKVGEGSTFFFDIPLVRA
jgi:signal transduction histidine kinase